MEPMSGLFEAGRIRRKIKQGWGNSMFQEKEFKDLRMLTVSQAARFLGVGKPIVYQLIDFNEIRAVRQRGAVLVEKESLETFRASGKLT